MKLQFKHQGFQLDAVESIASIFQGQPKGDGLPYLLDTGRGSGQLDAHQSAFRNNPIRLDKEVIQKQVRTQQIAHGLQPSQ